MFAPGAVLLCPGLDSKTSSLSLNNEFKWGRDGLQVYNHRFPDIVLYDSKVNLNEISLFCGKITDGYMQI